VIELARSYIKLTGPPVGKGLKALEQVAVEMSEKTTMRFYSVSVPDVGMTIGGDTSGTPYYVGGLSEQDTVKLISRSSQVLGDYDFFFEWGVEPTVEQINELIEMIDKALADCGCMYSITTK
jgi:hypothetical protein